MGVPTASFVGIPDKVASKAGALLVKIVHAWEATVHACKTARYNTRGLPESAAITQLCEAMEAALHGQGDTLIARVQLLGQPVNYSLAFVAENSGIKPFPLDVQDPAQVVQLLAETWTAMCELTREHTQALRDAGDPVSAHLAEHGAIQLEGASAGLQDILAGLDPEEALEAVGTEAAEVAASKPTAD